MKNNMVEKIMKGGEQEIANIVGAFKRNKPVIDIIAKKSESICDILRKIFSRNVGSTDERSFFVMQDEEVIAIESVKTFDYVVFSTSSDISPYDGKKEIVFEERSYDPNIGNELVISQGIFRMNQDNKDVFPDVDKIIKPKKWISIIEDLSSRKIFNKDLVKKMNEGEIRFSGFSPMMAGNDITSKVIKNKTSWNKFVVPSILFSCRTKNDNKNKNQKDISETNIFSNDVIETEMVSETGVITRVISPEEHYICVSPSNSEFIILSLMNDAFVYSTDNQCLGIPKTYGMYYCGDKNFKFPTTYNTIQYSPYYYIDVADISRGLSNPLTFEQEILNYNRINPYERQIKQFRRSNRFGMVDTVFIQILFTIMKYQLYCTETSITTRVGWRWTEDNISSYLSNTLHCQNQKLDESGIKKLYLGKYKRNFSGSYE
jgi:hypothetical protein